MESLAKSGTVKSRGDMDELKRCFNDFKDMITAHAAFEETVVFPFMEGNWSEKELNNLREAQESDEKKLMGDDAVQKTYDMITSLESSCGVTGLRDYTRRLK
jgi:hemerythrin superfamily protein